MQSTHLLEGDIRKERSIRLHIQDGVFNRLAHRASLHLLSSLDPSSNSPLRFDGPLLLPASCYPISVLIVLFLLLAIILVLPVCISGNPETALAILHRLVLASEVDTSTLDALLATLGKVASTCAELGRYGSILLNPIGQSILAVLDNTVYRLVLGSLGEAVQCGKHTPC